jgi:Mediator complex subunit 16
VVISADVRIYASWITLGYADGTVEVRKRTSIERAEEPQDNPRNIMTPFDGGFTFPKPDVVDDRYISVVFSPNLVAYATLHASGKVTIIPMKSDASSVLNSVVVAQRFTNALRKTVTFDDIYLLAEEFISQGLPAQNPKSDD